MIKAILFISGLGLALIALAAPISIVGAAAKPTPSGRSYCQAMTVAGLTSDGQACITITDTDSANKVAVETMLFLTNDSSQKANVTTTLSVNNVTQPGSITASYNPLISTRSGWKTSAIASPGLDTITANFSYNNQTIGSVSGQ